MSRKMYGYTALLATGLLAATLVGCGSDKKGSVASTSGGVATVGDTACFQCHAATADPLTGETFIEQYQRSLHAELGCESCHGGGAQHNGVGPLPFAKPDAARCAQCHDGVTTFNGKVAPLSSSPNFSNGNHANPFGEEEAHEAKCARCHSHEGSVLYGKDGFTGDKNIIDNTAYQPVLARDPETFNVIKCGTCHEHGGNLRQTKTRDLAGNIVTWDPNANKVIDQFDLCTSCHNVNTNEGKLIGSGNILQVYTSAAVGSGFKNMSTTPYYHNTAWYRTLPSTHYDQVASRTTASGTNVEGYVLRKNTKNPCYDCHGHEFKANTRAVAGRPERGTTIFTDWAQSGHAGGLLNQKIAAAAANPVTANRTTQPDLYASQGRAQVDAVMKAGANDTSGIGWTHYDWDDTASRGACQRCHTATGISNFLSNPTGYNATGSGNSFTHLAGWTNSNKKSNQQELLYCWGCHSNAGTGKLRDPGALTINYGSGATASSFTYPDVKGSNVCLACHTGRETGDTIKLDTDADGTRSFINSHYLTAGGTLFGTTGYEFAGLSYANPSFFGHDKIGTTAAPGTGSNGPCVGCHMKTSNSHKFSNVSTSAGVITKIRAQAACDTCHAGQFALTPASLETEKEEYDAAVAAIKAALAAKGIHFGEAHPYFYTAPYVAGGSNTGYTTWAANYGFAKYKDTMGAAFNANLLIHDPGGYAHNRFYAKRLIWDSIDFITDGTIGNVASMNTVIDGLGLAVDTATAAKTYLGNTRP